jgi:A/G-specific adenine glycosylase
VPDLLRELPAQAVAAVQKALLDWFAQESRQLPWRSTTDHYAIMVSEVMLQQTQVDRVIPVYLAFLQRFPTFQSLSDAPAAEVIRAWAGMGYNRRAMNLQRAAKQVAELYEGVLPNDMKALRGLPGVGEYTAAALACFALGQEVAVIDTNVRRVLGRVFYGPEGAPEKELAGIAQQALPVGESWSWNQALMDLGATVCTARRPTCLLCPVRSDCKAAGSFLAPNGAVAETRAPYKTKPEKFEGSSRYYRGRVVAHLRGLLEGESCSIEVLGSVVKPDYIANDEPWLLTLLQGLQRDGLVTMSGEGTATVVSLPL